MGWGSHPDTMCMVRAKRAASAVASDPESLEYLRAYRAEYGKIVEADGMRGGKEYLASIDKRIARWIANGGPEKPDFVP